MRFDPILGRLIHMQTDPGAGDGGEGVGAPEVPDWVPEQFRSLPEAEWAPAIARSYTEVRAETDRLREEARKDREQFQTALERLEATPPEPTRQVDPSEDPFIAAYQRALDEGDGAAALAIQMQLLGAQTQQIVGEQLKPITERFQSESATTREILIDNAEATVKAEAMKAGLDYEASRTEIAAAIQALGGLPASGTLADYSDAIRRGVRLVHAEAVIENSAAQEREHREKLSAMTTPAGASGRSASEPAG
jgi:hypothetical protein